MNTTLPQGSAPPFPSTWFHRRTREDGSTFDVLADERPDWLADAVMAAHDGEMPNDWRYATCAAIVELLEDDMGQDRGELADSLVSIYTADLLRWLADDVSRTGYVDQAHDEGLVQDRATLIQLIGAGQYLAIRGMVDIIAEALEANGGPS